MDREVAEQYKLLMSSFVSDICHGALLRDAGWNEHKKDQTENRLLEDNLIERRDGTIRITKEGLSKPQRMDEEGETLVLICLEIFETEKIQKEIRSVLESQDQDLMTSATVVGWWRMLSLSDFPVVPDKVLREEMSTVEWFTEAPKAALDLACSVAVQRWGSDLRALIDKYREILFLTDAGTALLSKIQNVLSWKSVIEVLSNSVIDAISFSWFTDYLSSLFGLHYPEALTYLQSRTWDLIISRTGTSEQDVVSEIDSLIGILNEKLPDIDWDELICLPW